MGDCVRIEEYRRTCANCYWHDDAMWACKRPGEGKEKLNMKNKDLRRLRCLVKAQTLWHLERLAYLDGCGDHSSSSNAVLNESADSTSS